MKNKNLVSYFYQNILTDLQNKHYWPHFKITYFFSWYPLLFVKIPTSNFFLFFYHTKSTNSPLTTIIQSKKYLDLICSEVWFYTWRDLLMLTLQIPKLILRCFWNPKRSAPTRCTFRHGLYMRNDYDSPVPILILNYNAFLMKVFQEEHLGSLHCIGKNSWENVAIIFMHFSI